jgi:tetratricopeptide (TPR) repeat protein
LKIVFTKRPARLLRPNSKSAGTQLTTSPVPKSIAEFREFADKARDGSNWPAAAFFYGVVLKTKHDDAGLWLQHGHTLKEVGLFAQARVSYDRAAALSPSDPEPLLQLAILSKLQGRFQDASELYERSQALGYANAAFIRGELDFLKRSGPPAGRAKRDEAVTFYLSSVSMPVSESDPAKLKQYLGAANYSYGYVLRGYQEALEGAGYRCEVIRNPEYYPDIRTKREAPAVHIGFYPPDGPRFLKGAHNIICIAWEFERLRSRAEAKSYHAFSDAASMLSRAQEVWALSGFGAEAVRRSSNIPTVRSVAAPVPTPRSSGRTRRPSLAHLQKAAVRLDRISWIPLAISPAMQSTLSGHAEGRRSSLLNRLLEADEDEAPVIFLCVFNVHDFRKQMKPMIEAFVRFSQDNANAYLLLKVSCIDSDKLDINTMMFMEQIADPGEMTAPLVTDRILMTTDALSREEMNTLNELASYYICTSHAEGQNLPLIETMGAGVVPLSVDHTAMQDYISMENAIVIPSQLMPLTPRLTARYGMYDTRTYYVDARSVHSALEQAMNQTDIEYATMSNAAVSAVKEHFGTSAFIEAVQRSLDAVAAAATETASA